MKCFILKILSRLARLHPKNSGKKYPQLWYCMPQRYKNKKPETIYCSFCGSPIIGTPLASQCDPNMPAAINWCSWCLEKNIPSLDAVTEAKAHHPVIIPKKRVALISYWLRPFLLWLCSKLTGHEPSKTEWGYGGGRFVDRNCRWCDKLLKVPISEDPPPNNMLEGLTGEMTDG